MRNRWLASVLLLFLSLSLLALSGCAGGAGGARGYDVYFMTQGSEEESALAAERRDLASGEDVVEGLLNCLLEGPKDEGLAQTIPSGVTLEDWSLENGLLTVDFSGRYGNLSGVALTLADYSVVLTLAQLEEVEAVTITVEGAPLSYRDHQRLTPQDVRGVIGPTEEGE